MSRRIGALVLALVLAGCYPFMTPEQHAENMAEGPEPGTGTGTGTRTGAATGTGTGTGTGGVPTVWFLDADGDGFGDPAITQTAVEAPASHVDQGEDCDDTNGTVYPAAPELCDGIVNACGGVMLAEEADDDGDGHVECTIDSGGWDGGPGVTGGDDCDDAEATVHPGAAEVCDGLPNACAGLPADEIDDDMDGFVECTFDAGGWDGAPAVTGGGDCNDSAADEYPGLTWYPDADGDGFGDAGAVGSDCGRVQASDVQDNTDCNDAASDELPGARWWPDVDGDGQGDGASSASTCARLQPSDVSDNLDCDDTDATVYVGAAQLCDGLANDCGSLPADEVDDDVDGAVECSIDAGGWDGVSGVTAGDDCDDADPTEYAGLSWYPDADGDLYGDSAASPTSCERALPTDVLDGTDCDDGDAGENPGVTWYPDGDGDGYGDGGAPGNACERTGVGTEVDNNGDCNDGSAIYNPGSLDVVGDGLDQNCDGVPGVDVDQDAYASMASGGTDCDDGNAAVSPAESEVPNDVDDDCANGVDDGTVAADDDGDGWCEGWDDDGDGGAVTADICTDSASVGDCNDGDGTVSPSEVEQPNWIDDDCAGGVDDGTVAVDDDVDGACEGWDHDADPLTADICTDGTVTGDCDDTDPTLTPLATDLVGNGIDDNCDGIDGTDADLDGFAATWSGGDDCDDDPTDDTVADVASMIYPGATYYEDADGDLYGDSGVPMTPGFCGLPVGYSVDSTDCEPTSAAGNPGITGEVHSDGVDNNCDGVIVDWVGLSAGYRQTCAFDTLGELYCWGTGQGAGNHPTGHFVTDVELGNSNIGCVQDDVDDLHCWNGSSVEAEALPAGPYLQGTVAFHSGHASLAIRTNGTIEVAANPVAADWVATGKPGGAFKRVGCDFSSSAPVECVGLTTGGTLSLWSIYGGSNVNGAHFSENYADMAYTRRSMCGVRSSDGGINCWGQYWDAANPLPSGSFQTIDGWSGGAGSSSYCGIDTTDSVQCWSEPVGLTVTVGAPTTGTWVDVSVGLTHACAIDDTANITCWGDNSFSQLDVPL